MQSPSPSLVELAQDVFFFFVHSLLFFSFSFVIFEFEFPTRLKDVRWNKAFQTNVFEACLDPTGSKPTTETTQGTASLRT